MTITEFARRIAAVEGLKRQVDIAQIMEILKTINDLLGYDDFYRAVRGMSVMKHIVSCQQVEQAKRGGINGRRQKKLNKALKKRRDSK